MDADRENILLARLKSDVGDSESTMLELVLLYERRREPVKAIPYLQQLIANTQDADKVARYYLHLGQSMEQAGNYASASSFYSQALAVETTDKRVSYFIHNNLGYCLTVLGRYEEAGQLLVKAISIDPEFPNAHKNCGICSEAQGEFEDAVKFYLVAILADPYDRRSRQHLDSLFSKHPELQGDQSYFNEMVEERKKGIVSGETLEEFMERMP